jgi:integrase
MTRIARPRRPRPEDLDVVIVTPADVERMLRATADWQEFLCLSVLAYLGLRRDSVSRLRWRDVDLAEGTIRFREKGNKISIKPMPDELRLILRSAIESAEISCGPDDYVIPNRRPASVRRAERSNKVIWETVRTLARGWASGALLMPCGVRSRLPSLRATQERLSRFRRS